MTKQRAFFLLLLLAIVSCSFYKYVNAKSDIDDEDADETDNNPSSPSRPIEINKDRFSSVINEPEIGTLLMFYAPWCGHCKRMVSTWSELATRHNEKKKFLIGKVDCSDQTELCSDHDVLAYPTFLFYKKNSPNGIFYDGKRDLDSIEAFLYGNYISDDASLEKEDDVKKQAVYELDEKNFMEFISKGSHFIKFYAPWCGHCQRLAPIWEELGNKYIKNRNIKISKIDCTKNGEICSSYQIRGYPTLIFFQDGKMIKPFDRQRTITEFTSFIDELVKQFDKLPEINEEEKENEQQHIDDTITTGYVLDLNEINFQSVLARKGFLFVKFYAPWCSHCKDMAQTWKDLALKFKDSKAVRIGEVDCTNNVELCMNQGIEGYPSLILYKNGLRIVDYVNDRGLASFVEFLNSHLQHEDL